MAALQPIGDRSYGIIPIRTKPGILPHNPSLTRSNTQVLLVHQKTARPNLACFWGFPKGHAEDGDASLEHTAIRELEEETGLAVRLSDILRPSASPDPTVEASGSFKETYVNPVRKVGKEVRYWVALVRQGDRKLRLQEKEVADARWCSWDEAEALITFQEGRNVLLEAVKILE